MILFILLFTLPVLAEDTRVKIAVIDTGIEINKEIEPYLCKGKIHKDLTGTGLEDTNGHGTNIAGIIAQKINKKTHCLFILKFYLPYSYSNIHNTIKAFKLALQENAKYVNYSSHGQMFDQEERDVIEPLIKKKIFVIVAAGNGAEELSFKKCASFPACYNFDSRYFRVVGNGTSNTNRSADSNYGEKVTDWRKGNHIVGLFGHKMSGTSQSTATVTGELAGKNVQ